MVIVKHGEAHLGWFLRPLMLRMGIASEGTSRKGRKDSLHSFPLRYAMDLPSSFGMTEDVIAPCCKSFSLLFSPWLSTEKPLLLIIGSGRLAPMFGGTFLSGMGLLGTTLLSAFLTS